MACTVIKQAIPSSLCFVIGMLQENINMIFLGHLNQPALIAGIGIGNMFMNMIGLSIVTGLNGALETLISQAYGVGDLKQCGVYLNRGRFVMIAFFVPVIFVLCKTDVILTMVGQDPKVSSHA